MASVLCGNSFRTIKIKRNKNAARACIEPGTPRTNNATLSECPNKQSVESDVSQRALLQTPPPSAHARVRAGNLKSLKTLILIKNWCKKMCSRAIFRGYRNRTGFHFFLISGFSYQSFPQHKYIRFSRLIVVPSHGHR